MFTSALLWFQVPKDRQRSNFTVELHHLRLVLLNKWLIILSVVLLGLQIGSTIYSSFMAYYLESAVHMNVGEAGTIASLASLFALASAPFAGRLFDKYGNAKRLLLASGVLMAVGVGVAFLGTVYSAILAGVLIGLASGAGFTFGFSAAREANKLDKEYETLSVSWVNSISLFGDFLSPLLFSYFVIQYGYSPAWLYMAVLAFVLTIPVLFPKVPRQKRAHPETYASPTDKP
jgi:MFS family permease